MNRIMEMLGKMELDLEEVESILQVVTGAEYVRHWQDIWGVVVEFKIGQQFFRIIGSQDSECAFLKMLAPGGQIRNHRDWTLLEENRTPIPSWRRAIVIGAMKNVLEMWVSK